MRGVRLSRNFGKEIAMTAGLDAAKGQAVVFIDADLQDPPELIGEFHRLWQAGYQNVYGLRISREEDNWAKRVTASAFYTLFNRLSRTPLPAHAGDFRLLGPDIVAAIRAFRSGSAS
uniref:CAZy families GT2 protein n=1 Tax=uncultured Xanthomonas sp. TaxID=152831 RepID=A0A060BLN3_9XANT|nr:CAZy families GT2 protein [uncultured Xanthomonas sp.]